MSKNLLASILIIAAIGLYFTLTQSVFNDARAVKVKNDEFVTALASADEIVRLRNEVIRKYNSISEQDRIRLDQMVPSAVDNIRLVIDLNNLALRNGFALADVKATVPSNANQAAAQGAGVTLNGGATGTSLGSLPGIPGISYVSQPVLDRVEVSFKTTATYQQFIDFMQDLELSLRIIDLTRLKMNVSEAGMYDFEVQLQTYWLRQ